MIFSRKSLINLSYDHHRWATTLPRLIIGHDRLPSNFREESVSFLSSARHFRNIFVPFTHCRTKGVFRARMFPTTVSFEQKVLFVPFWTFLVNFLLNFLLRQSFWIIESNQHERNENADVVSIPEHKLRVEQRTATASIIATTMTDPPIVHQ